MHISFFVYQKNMNDLSKCLEIYNLPSSIKSMHSYATLNLVYNRRTNWTLYSVMEIIQMLLCLCIWTPSKMLSMFRVIPIPLILSYHHIVCALHRCHVLNDILFPVCFCFFPVGSGVDVSNDIESTTPEDQYLSIDEQVKKKNPDIYFIWLSTNKASSLPPLNLWFQSISKLTILQHTVQLSFINR
jgi:hypothetical protein